MCYTPNIIYTLFWITARRTCRCDSKICHLKRNDGSINTIKSTKTVSARPPPIPPCLISPLCPLSYKKAFERIETDLHTTTIRVFCLVFSLILSFYPRHLLGTPVKLMCVTFVKVMGWDILLSWPAGIKPQSVPENPSSEAV